MAAIVLDNPPTNGGSAEVRRGVLEAVDAVRRDDAIGAAVIIGAGSIFVGGSDLREFGRPLEERGEAALHADLDWFAGLIGPGLVRSDVRHVLAQGTGTRRQP